MFSSVPSFIDISTCLVSKGKAALKSEDVLENEIQETNNISSIPCLVVFKDGKEVERIIGSHSAEMIEKKIRACLC